MTERINLEQSAMYMLGDMIDGQDTLDLNKLRDDIPEYADGLTDNLTCYYSQCFDLIDEYENHASAPDESESTFTADQYRDAAKSWAEEIARAVLYHEASEIIDGLDDYAERLCSDVSKVDDEQAPDVDDLRVSAQCPHGWAPHEREDDDGTCYWLPNQLEGCHAVAINAGPFWLSYTWTQTDADD